MNVQTIQANPVFQELAASLALDANRANDLAMATQFVYIDWMEGRNIETSVAKEAECFNFTESQIRDAFATL